MTEPAPNILHESDVRKVIDEEGATVFAHKTTATVATPAAPGATYNQAEVVALRTALASVLVALRTSGVIAP